MKSRVLIFVLASLLVSSIAFAGESTTSDGVSMKREAELCAEHGLGTLGMGALAGAMDTLGRFDLGLAYVVGAIGSKDLKYWDSARQSGNQITAEQAHLTAQSCAATFEQLKSVASDEETKLKVDEAHQLNDEAARNLGDTPSQYQADLKSAGIDLGSTPAN